MRNTLTILLISIHLTGNTEVGQLLKLPELVTHYFQHHRQDHNISFVDFIYMHYWGDDGTKADDEADSKLPCHNAAHNTIPLVYSPMTQQIIQEMMGQGATLTYKSCLEEGISSKHVLLILQPPRTV